MPDDEHEPGQERIDEIARAAGAALRRPAPSGGPARVRASHRRRRVTRTVAGASAVALTAVGTFALLVDGGPDDGRVVTDTGPGVVASDVATTAPPATTAATPHQGSAGPAVDSTTSSVAPLTTPPPTPVQTATIDATAPGWQPGEDQWPPLAFIPCCGTNWEGEPSPAVPADPAEPLPAGIYHAAAATGYRTDTGVLRLEVRPYVPCADLDQYRCGGDGPYEPTELGVPEPPSRVVDLALGGSVRVAVAGFECLGPERLGLDVQVGSGADLARLFDELDAAYELAIGAPLRAGADPQLLADELAAHGTAGFFDAGCPAWTRFAWQPSAGPTIIARLDSLAGGGIVATEPVDSPSAEWIWPTALAVDERGATTAYFFAGFLS